MSFFLLLNTKEDHFHFWVNYLFKRCFLLQSKIFISALLHHTLQFQPISIFSRFLQRGLFVYNLTDLIHFILKMYSYSNFFLAGDLWSDKIVQNPRFKSP